MCVYMCVCFLKGGGLAALLANLRGASDPTVAITKFNSQNKQKKKKKKHKKHKKYKKHKKHRKRHRESAGRNKKRNRRQKSSLSSPSSKKGGKNVLLIPAASLPEGGEALRSLIPLITLSLTSFSYPALSVSHHVCVYF